MEEPLTSKLLTQIDWLPAGLLNAEARDLYQILPTPTLMHLPGRDPQPLFISVLLHGNETTGLLAIQSLLRRYLERALPRSLSVFFGNISAARAGQRRLDNQSDYNRIWPGAGIPECEETRMTRAIVEEMAQRRVFASIDVHNNTGINPHYACVNRLDPGYLYLASLFGRLVVHFTYPKGVQSAAFAPLCPAVTLECGKPGQAYGVEHASQFLDDCLHLSEIPKHPLAHQAIDLFHTVGRVTIRDDISFGFGDKGRALSLRSDLDHLNFTEVAAGRVWGRLRPGLAGMPIIASGEHGEDVTDRYFGVEDGNLVLRKAVMPSMLTLDERVIRQDCLCYLMERISHSPA